MNSVEQKLLDKFYEGRKTWSHDFIITLLGVLEDEADRRINDFYKALKLEVSSGGIQDD